MRQDDKKEGEKWEGGGLGRRVGDADQDSKYKDGRGEGGVMTESTQKHFFREFLFSYVHMNFSHKTHTIHLHTYKMLRTHANDRIIL